MRSVVSWVDGMFYEVTEIRYGESRVGLVAFGSKPDRGITVEKHSSFLWLVSLTGMYMTRIAFAEID